MISRYDLAQIWRLLGELQNVAGCFRNKWPDIREHTYDRLTMPELLGRLGYTIQHLALDAEHERARHDSRPQGGGKSGLSLQ